MGGKYPIGLEPFNIMKKVGFTTPDLAGCTHPLKTKMASGCGKMAGGGCGLISLPGRTYGGINRRTGCTLFQANQVSGSGFMIIQPSLTAKLEGFPGL